MSDSLSFGMRDRPVLSDKAFERALVEFRAFDASVQNDRAWLRAFLEGVLAAQAQERRPSVYAPSAAEFRWPHA